MLLLYKDPKGETIGSTTKAHSVTGNHVSQIQRSNSKSDWEEKVATLEKTLRERDAKIATLMRNGSEKVIISFVTHNYYKLQGVSSLRSLPPLGGIILFKTHEQ